MGSTVAVSWLPEMNCVGIGVPFSSTWTPGAMKLEPERTTVEEPMLRLTGAAVSNTGTGFKTWTLTIVTEFGLSTLVACTTTTLLGLGTTAGAV